MNNFTLLNNSQISSKLPLKLLENGTKKVLFKPLQHKEAIDVTSTMDNQTSLTTEKDLFTVEFLPQSNVETWNAKLPLCKNNFRPLKLSKTLDQALISKEKAFHGFWNKSCLEMSQKLWLPTETDSVDLDMNSLSKSFNISIQPWKYLDMIQSKNLLQNSEKTSYQSLQFSQPDITVPESIRYSKKIRIYPNEEQKGLLSKCLGTSRYFYNQTINLLKTTYNDNKTLKGFLSLPTIRPLVMTSDKEVNKSMLWQKEVPYDTRQLAINDAIIATKGCLTKVKQGQVKKFELHFRSKKQPEQSFKVNKKALDPQTFFIFPSRLKDKKLRLRKRDIKKWYEDDTLDGDFTITRSFNDKWYICLPRTRRQQTIDRNNILESVFLDPGERTFQTAYSPDGIGCKLGKDFVRQELDHIAAKHDKLWSLAYTPNSVGSKTKSHLRKRCQELRQKIKNKVANLHNQCCKFLNSFKNVFIPHFQVHNMASKTKSIGSSITRKMMHLSHGAFRAKLMQYRASKGLSTWIVGEEYTTQTCTCCGERKEMKDLKVFECRHCGVSLDRDYNGARNICLLLATKFL